MGQAKKVPQNLGHFRINQTKIENAKFMSCGIVLNRKSDKEVYFQLCSSFYVVHFLEPVYLLLFSARYNTISFFQQKSHEDQNIYWYW